MSSAGVVQELSISENIEIINELIKSLQLSNNFILTNNQIQILLSLSCSDIINLYKKYKSLSNDVLLIDDIIKQAVQNNGLVLEYISYDKLTEEICELAVKNNSFAIQYIPDNKITDEIVKLAVQNNPCIIGYIHEDLKTNEIIKLAVEIDGNTLRASPLQKAKNLRKRDLRCFSNLLLCFDSWASLYLDSLLLCRLLGFLCFLYLH